MEKDGRRHKKADARKLDASGRPNVSGYDFVCPPAGER